jgi:hypothetical protein
MQRKLEDIKILDYETVLRILQNYISIEENYEDVMLTHGSIEDCTHHIFEEFIEVYYLKTYEKYDYDNKKDIPLSSLSNEYQFGNYRLKNNLNEEEMAKLKLIRKKIFKYVNFKKIELFKLSPFCYVHQEIRMNYQYKITSSLIPYYIQYKLMEIIFGNILEIDLMFKSPLQKYFDYKTMKKLYEEIKKEKWVNYLFKSFPEIEVHLQLVQVKID